MGWIGDHWWEVWLAVAMVLAVCELVSLDLILAMLAVGAAAGAIVAALSAPLLLQVVAASGVSLAMLLVVRPGLIRQLHHGADLRLGPQKLVGRSGTVTHAISPRNPGRVRIGGEVWTASPYDELSSIPEGAAIEVLRIEGATAYVHQIAELGD